VLPPQSADLLPKPLAELMLNPASPIVDFIHRILQWKRQAHVAGSARAGFRLLLTQSCFWTPVNQVIKADDDGKEPLPTQKT
jgi:hypothetical protein